MTARYATCRVVDRFGDRCTGEAVDPAAELLICTRHLAQAQRLIRDAVERAGAAGKTRREGGAPGASTTRV